jgi:hypothetical protein
LHHFERLIESKKLEGLLGKKKRGIAASDGGVVGGRKFVVADAKPLVRLCGKNSRRLALVEARNLKFNGAKERRDNVECS